VRRVVLATLLFAVLAIAATGTLALVAYHSVELGLEQEFVQRLRGVAITAATQVSAADIADARRVGEAGGGYLALQVGVQQLCATPGNANASVLDSTGIVLYECRDAERQGLPSVLDSLARPTLRGALAGRGLVSDPYRFEGRVLRAGIAPVFSAGARGHVTGVVAVEAEPGYLAPLAALRRRLALITMVIGAALAVLAWVVVRTAWSSAALERRLSHAENLAAMGRLTATLAHEIKNPLAIIRGSARRLGRLEPEAQQRADEVVGEVDRLTATVNRYLQFARGGETGPGAGDARAALDATLALLEGEAASRRVTLARDGAWPETAPVTLDPDRLKQVYLNLLLNAFEALSGGGTVTVSIGESRGRFEIQVRDSGPGIAPDTLRRMGEPFVTSKAQGTGLGLFLTRRLVESAGGTLEIGNAAGGGALARVTLPRGRG
jgi:signal transduction histidine kinase